MIGALRTSAKSWVAKVLLLLLVASFAVWGVSGQITSGVGGDTVLTAGETTVSTDEYRLIYDRAYRSLQNQLGTGITRTQANQFGVDDQVIAQLAADAVLDEQARLMRLGLTQEGIAQVIADFDQQSGNPSSDRTIRQQILRQIGFSETQFLETIQGDAIRGQLVDATVEGLQAPEVFLNAYVSHRGETRDVNYLRINEDQLTEIAAPDETTLQAYFDENLGNYRAPEYRQIRYVRLTPEEIADPASVADSSVRAEYDNNLDRFGQDEQRTVQQIVFADAESAQQAYDALVAGGTFEDVAAEQGRTLADVTLGTLTRSDLPNANLAAAAFDIEAPNGFSSVVDGPFGPVIMHVSEIIEASVRPFEDVADEIRQELALVDASDILQSVHDGYEDARAGGMSMQEAAAAQQLEVVTIDQIDARGLDPEGNIVEGPAETEQMLQEAFQAEVLFENLPIQAGRGGFLWYEVVDVTPDRDRTLDEVRNQAIEDWRQEQATTQLDDEANRVAEMMRNQGFEDTQTQNTYQSGNRLGLSRTGTDGEFGPEAIAEVFSVGPEGVSVARTADGAGRFVFVVQSINQPLGNSQSLADTERNGISLGLANDVLDQMIGRAQAEFAVTINPTAIERAQQPR